MLSSDYLFTLTDEISQMYEELNTSVINDMARRIAKMDYTSPSTIFQAERAAEIGALYDEIVKKISMQTGKSQEELKRLFKEAGFKNYENNLRKHSMSYKNIQLSERAKNILISGINKTGGVLHNMTMTTANEAQNNFIHITDLAYNQIVNGTMDYNTAIRYAIKDLANKGLKVIDYKTGYKQRIDSAVRTCVLTGVNQTTGLMTELQRQEVGADGYETTAHSGARPEHALWQGKQFYADKPVKGYEDFKTATGYGTVTGLKGANCRHDFFWVFLGEDEPSYTKSEIKALNNKIVKYNGKEMTIAEAETTMRYIERKTREWKRQANALSAAGLDNSFEKMKAKEWSNKYKDFASKTGISKRNERLVVYDKNNTKNNIIPNKNVTNSNKNAKINIKNTYNNKIEELQDVLLDMNEARRKHWNLTLTSKEDIINFPQLKDMSFSVDLQNVDRKIIDAIICDYKKLGNEYYTTLTHIGIFDDKDLVIRPNSGGYAFTKVKTLTGEIHFNQKILSDFDDYIETMRNCSKFGHIPKNINPENYKFYVSTHEFAHTIYNSSMLEKNLIGMDNKIYKNFEKELSEKFKEYKAKINNINEEIEELNKKFVLDTKNYTAENKKRLKELKRRKDEIFVSNYAIRDDLEDEFMAECFSEAKLSSKPSKTSIEVLELIDKYFKR